MVGVFTSIGTGFSEWAATFEQTKATWFAQLVSSARAAADAIVAAFNAARQTLSTSFPGDPGGIPAMPRASGGYVRGPGSGTSDSILARLSNGEFVMRAAAVDRWGPQFMAALNSLRNPFGGFASGGLRRGIPSFAGGGMVHAHGGGATVNLVFPGGTFALRADNETVGALTREARRAGMLSGRAAGGAASADADRDRHRCW